MRSVSPDPSGQWLASSSDDGSVRLWEVRTGRCTRTWTLGGAVHCVAWCPNAALSLLAAVVDTRVILLPTGAPTNLPSFRDAVMGLRQPVLLPLSVAGQPLIAPVRFCMSLSHAPSMKLVLYATPPFEV